MKHFFSHVRVALASLLVCVAGYAGLILGLAQALTPQTADGHLLAGPDGVLRGSRLVGQNFQRPEYFWPRLSALGYNAAGAGGSNLAPASGRLRERAGPRLEALGARPDRPAPADLVTASGSGLDPHVTVAAARFQVERVAAARGLPVDEVAALVEAGSFAPGGWWTPGRTINVLELNLALDKLNPK